MATLNQKVIATQIIKKVRKGETVSVSKEMRKAGYSKHTSRQPAKITASKGFQELLDKYLPEQLLLEKGKEGLQATTIRFTPKGKLLKVPDYSAQHKFYNTGLQLRGKLKPDVTPPPSTVINIFAGDQLKRIAARVLNGDPAGEGTPDRLSDSDEPAV